MAQQRVELTAGMSRRNLVKKRFRTFPPLKVEFFKFRMPSRPKEVLVAQLFTYIHLNSFNYGDDSSWGQPKKLKNEVWTITLLLKELTSLIDL